MNNTEFIKAMILKENNKFRKRHGKEPAAYYADGCNMSDLAILQFHVRTWDIDDSASIAHADFVAKFIWDRLRGREVEMQRKIKNIRDEIDVLLSRRELLMQELTIAKNDYRAWEKQMENEALGRG